jgi:hypothetical protein
MLNIFIFYKLKVIFLFKLSHLNSNSEWIVYKSTALSKQIVTSEDLFWWVTSYILEIKRVGTYHVFNLIMPTLGN